MLTEKRGADVLVPFIRRWARPGSIPISDCWAGYTSELDEFYLRERVNHSDEFAHFAVVDGLELSANTNHIEREWREVREVLWCKSPEQYVDELNKEVFRLRFLAGKTAEEQAYIMMQKNGRIGELMF